MAHICKESDRGTCYHGVVLLRTQASVATKGGQVLLAVSSSALLRRNGLSFVVGMSNSPADVLTVETLQEYPMRWCS